MRTLFWLFACCAVAAGLAADTPVPAGKAAVAEVVFGTVNLVNAAGDSSALATGQALDYGDRIVSASDGRVLLRLASRASARLAPNSEMSFQDPGQRNGTFISLVKGWARFLVGARAPGEAFEVNTDNAVAAVKGTDMEVGIEDNGSTYACVYSSDHSPALSFGNPNGGQGIELNPGQGATFDGNNFKQFQDLGPSGQPNGNRYQGLPNPTPTGDQGNGTGSPNPNPSLGGSQNKLDTAIQGAMNQLGQDLKADNNWETQDRNNDLASGRVGVDRFGNQVRMSNNLIRTASDTVVLSTLSQRTTGPNQGVTSASLTTQYNQALPANNWLGVVKLSLTDPANLSGGMPIWYRIQSVFNTSDPVGDSLILTTLFSAPYLDPSSNMTQAYIQDLWAYTPQKGGLPSLTSHAIDVLPPLATELYYDVHSSQYELAVGNIGVDSALLAGPQSGYAYDTTGIYSSASPLEGGVALTYSVSFYSTAVGSINYNYNYTQTFHILDGQGNLQPLPTNISSSFGTYLSGGFGPLNFLGVDRSLNIETSIDVPGFFKQPIDLLVMPDIFDSMGGILPIFMQPSCNCG